MNLFGPKSQPFKHRSKHNGFYYKKDNQFESSLVLPKPIEEIVSIFKSAASKTGLEEIYLVGSCIARALLSKMIFDFELVYAKNSTLLLTEALLESFQEIKKFSIFNQKFFTSEAVEHPFNGKNQFYIYFRNLKLQAKFSVKIREIMGESVAEDAKAVDLTINAIYYCLLTDKIIDPFGGRADLQDSILKSVVSPEQSFYRSPSRFFQLGCQAIDLKFSLDKKLEAYLKAIDFCEDFYIRYRTMFPGCLEQNVTELFEDKDLNRRLTWMRKIGMTDLFKVDCNVKEAIFQSTIAQAIAFLDLLDKNLNKFSDEIIDKYYEGHLPQSFYISCKILAFGLILFINSKILCEAVLTSLFNYSAEEIDSLFNFFDQIVETVENKYFISENFLTEKIAKLLLKWGKNKWTMLIVV